MPRAMRGRRGTPAGWAPSLFFLAVLLQPWRAAAFVQVADIGKGERVVYAHWAKTTVPYWLDPGGSGIARVDATALAARAFGTWESVSTSRIRFESEGPAPDPNGDGNLTFADFEQDLQDRSFELDRRNTLIFDDTGEILDYLFGEDSGVLGLAFPVFASSNGAILDADIIVSVPNVGLADLESTLIHEIGHLSGLGHSPIFGVVPDSELPTMFPFASSENDTAMRSLEADDIAGISALYAEAGFVSSTASLSGRIRMSDGTEAFGVHVLAYQPGTEVAVGTLSGLPEGPGTGSYRIEGLPPGAFTLLIEAIDGGADVGGVTLENIGGIFFPSGLTGFPTEIFNNVRLQGSATRITAAPDTETRGVDFVTGIENAGAPLEVEIEVRANRGHSQPASGGGGGGCSIAGSGRPSGLILVAVLSILVGGVLALGRFRAPRARAF